MRKFMFLAFVALALCGCGDSSDNIEVTKETRNPPEIFWDSGGFRMRASTHFITEYFPLSKVIVKINAAGGLDIRVGGGGYYATYFDKDYKHYEKAEYFSELYGDTHYTGQISGWLHPVIAYPIDKMTISCDADFDAEHPAGTPLDDIVNLEYSTYYKFINSGYKLTFDNLWVYDREEEVLSSPLNSINAEVTKLSKIILEISDEDNKWANFFGRLVFTSAPAEPGEYTFTLGVTTNGKTYNTTFDYTFE